MAHFDKFLIRKLRIFITKYSKLKTFEMLQKYTYNKTEDSTALDDIRI